MVPYPQPKPETTMIAPLGPDYMILCRSSSQVTELLQSREIYLSGGTGYLVMIWGGIVAGPGSRRRAKFNQQTPIIHWMPVMGYDSVVDKPELICGLTVVTHHGRSKSHV